MPAMIDDIICDTMKYGKKKNKIIEHAGENLLSLFRKWWWWFLCLIGNL